MALTQVKALGIAADSIDETKLADDSIDSEHYNDGSIDTAHLAADAVTGAKIADDAIDSEHYAAGSIDTAHIADDQITLAKMASGTDGQIITYDASGNPTAVGPGTDGQVLTSTGAGSPPAFEAAAAGGATINNATANELVTVASTTTQLDAEANLTFDGTSLVLTGDQMIKANDAAAKLKFKSGNVASNDEELGSVTWQSSADNVNASIAAHRATWANDGYLVFKTASSGTLSEQLRIDRFGNLDVARGNIEIKTAGKGIDFSAQTSSTSGTVDTNGEILDHYEEGTWSLAVSSGTISGTGYYTRIGNIVHIQMFDSSLTGTRNSSTLEISGLPFTAAKWTPGSMYAYDYSSEGSSMASIAVAGNSTNLRVVEWGNEAIGTDFGNGYFVAQCTYRIA